MDFFCDIKSGLTGETLLKQTEKTIQVSARLRDRDLDYGLFQGELEDLKLQQIEQIKKKAKAMLATTSPTEKGIAHDLLDYYGYYHEGEAIAEYYKQPPFLRPLTGTQKKHLERMLELANAADRAGLEKYWNALDSEAAKDRPLRLAHQWYLYLLNPSEQREAFVRNFPPDFDGVSDFFRISKQFRPQASAGSALKDLGRIAQSGDTLAIERLTQGIRGPGIPLFDESMHVLVRVLERQPKKTIRAIAAHGWGLRWSGGIEYDAYEQLGKERADRIRKELLAMQPQANEREKKLIKGFVEYKPSQKDEGGGE